MAASFGSETTQVQEVGSSAQPRAGVTENPVFIEAISNTVSNVGDMLKARKEQMNQSAISDFAKQQLLVADSVAQGKRSSAFAQTVLRQNLIKAIDANPNMANDFLKTQSSIMGLSGGGKVAAEGTKEEQREIARKDQLVKADLLPHNFTQEQFQNADEAARVAKAAFDKHQARMQTLATEKAAIDTSAARRREIEEIEKQETNKVVAEAAPAELMVVKNRLQGILDNTALSEADKVMAIQDASTEWMANNTAILGNVESDTRDMVQELFKGIETQFINRAKGLHTDEQMKRGLERQEATIETLLKADPKIARLAVMTKVMGPETISKLIVRDSSNEAINLLTKFVAGGDINSGIQQPTLLSDKAMDKKVIETYLSSVSDGINSNDPERVANSIEQAKVLFEGIEDDAGRITRDPKRAISLVDWLATPGFYKAQKANPEAFTAFEGVQSVLNDHYHDEVLGMVAKEFKSNKVFIPAGSATAIDGPVGRAAVRTPSDELVEAVGTESGMTFKPIDPNNQSAVREARRLNTTLKPIINTSVRASAHMAGHNNYKQVWESNADQITGVGNVDGGAGEDTLAGGDAGDDLTTQDFLNPRAEIKTESLPAPVAQDQEFMGEVGRVAEKYGTAASDLLAVMDFETGGSFDPAQKNAAGSSGTGLIQFMAATAKELGTSTEALSQMGRSEQMKYVDKYLESKLRGVKNPTVQDLYMAVLWPRAVGKPDDYVLWKKGSKQYGPNSGLDRNGNGTITKAEATAKVVSFVDKYKA